MSETLPPFTGGEVISGQFRQSAGRHNYLFSVFVLCCHLDNNRSSIADMLCGGGAGDLLSLPFYFQCSFPALSHLLQPHRFLLPFSSLPFLSVCVCNCNCPIVQMLSFHTFYCYDYLLLLLLLHRLTNGSIASFYFFLFSSSSSSLTTIYRKQKVASRTSNWATTI